MIRRRIGKKMSFCYWESSSTTASKFNPREKQMGIFERRGWWGRLAGVGSGFGPARGSGPSGCGLVMLGPMVLDCCRLALIFWEISEKGLHLYCMLISINKSRPTHRKLPTGRPSEATITDPPITIWTHHCRIHHQITAKKKKRSLWERSSKWEREAERKNMKKRKRPTMVLFLKIIFYWVLDFIWVFRFYLGIRLFILLCRYIILMYYMAK